jgi:hemoglobin
MTQGTNCSTHNQQENFMSASLYERLGGSEGITRIAGDLVDIHLVNPAISNRFANSDIDKLKHNAATFFISGTGGPNVYEGKDMLAAHKGMNISATEFMAVLDDALAALQKNNIGQREQEEVLFVFYSMRGDVVLV